MGGKSGRRWSTYRDDSFYKLTAPLHFVLSRDGFDVFLLLFHTIRAFNLTRISMSSFPFR